MGLTETVQAALPHAVRAVEDILAEEAGPAAPDGNQVSEQDADEQECMADLTRNRNDEIREGGARHAEQADQGGAHRRRAGDGDRFTA
jgi:hypothetical protein